MKSFIALLILLSITLSVAKAQIRYLDNIFSNYYETLNIQYGEAIDIGEKAQKLYLDIYEPYNDKEKSRPLIVWMHGGNFIGGDRDEWRIVDWCKNFAMKGYVTSTIDFRLGVTSYDQLGLEEALLRSVQDAKSAIRFFRANSSKYRIDTNRIIVGGASSGSFIAIHLAYWDQSEVRDSINQAKWGNIEGNSGNPGYSSKVHAVVNNWGAILDTAWIGAGDPPIQCFQGKLDQSVPIDLPKQDQAVMYGAKAISRVATRLGIYNELSIMYAMSHGFSVFDSLLIDSLNHCTTNFLYKVITELIVDVNEKENDMGESQVYPNPATDFIMLPENFDRIEVYDINCQKTVLKKDLSGKYSISNFSPGLYQIYAFSENITRPKAYKFIKMP
jgi:hypothetical protein